MKALSIFLFVIFCTFVTAQEMPASLEKCFQWALQHNVDIEVTRYGQQIASQDISLAESEFNDIFLNAGASYSRLDTRLTQTDDANFNVSLAKRFLPGTEVAVSYSVDYVRSSDFEIFEIVGLILGDDDLIIDKLNTSALTFQVTQPLLKNFGIDQNSALINIAKKQKEIAKAEVDRQINDTLAQVEVAYWTWISLLKIKTVLGLSITEAEKYKRDYVEPKAGLAEGVLPSDVDQATIDIEKRKDLLISIEKKTKDWEDKLKRLIFPFDKKKETLSKKLPIWEDGLASFVITNTTLPDLEYETALKYRPELKQLEGKVESFDLLTRQKKNQLLPEVNLIGRYSFLGQSQETNIAIANTFDGNHSQWKIGIEFEYALGNFGARSQYNKAKLQKKQAEVQKKQVEYDICLQVKLARNAVEEAVAKYKNTSSILKKAKERLIGVERRYQNPLPYDFNLIFFVQDAEVQRTEAQVSQYQAILQFKIAMAQLKNAQAKYVREIYKKYNVSKK